MARPVGLVRSSASVSSPTAAWTAQQIVEAFPEDSAPRYLLRDRDAVYGDVFRKRMKGLAIGEVIIAARSPWQNPYAERMIGTIRRDLLNHVIVLGEGHLRRQQRCPGEFRIPSPRRRQQRGKCRCVNHRGTSDRPCLSASHEQRPDHCPHEH